MPSFEQLGIGRGIAQGLEKATYNLMNIQLKKDDLQRQKKQDDISFKVKKLQLQKLEDDLDPDKLERADKLLRAQQKAKTSAWESANTLLEDVWKEKKDEYNKAQSVSEVVASILGTKSFPSAKKGYTESQVRSEAKRIAKAEMGKDPLWISREPTNQEVLDAIPAARDFLNKSTQRGSAQSAFDRRYDELEAEGLSEPDIFKTLKEEGI